MRYAKAILALTMLIVCGNAFALTKEVTIDRSNNSLPLTKLRIADKSTYWSMYKSKGADSVYIYGLNKNDAYSLLKAAETAKGFYAEIIEGGRCPTGTITSERFGRLTSDSNSISFEVVCEKNNIMVRYVMSDEYAINIVYYHVEWQDVHNLAASIVKHYE